MIYEYSGHIENLCQWLTAQRVRLQAISSNVANARSTRTEEGTPYRRQMLMFQAVEANEFGFNCATVIACGSCGCRTVRCAFSSGFDPGHPDADDDGYVQYPNVDILHEMVDLMNTSRTYEANTNVTETT